MLCKEIREYLLWRDDEVASMFDEEKTLEEYGELKNIRIKDPVWFVCKKGHNFRSRIDSVMASKWTKYRGCPYCSGRIKKAGYNDLQSQRPELLKYWDYAGNTVKPDEIGLKDNDTKLNWICENGHRFKSTVYQMSISVMSGNNGCPYCSGKIVKQGFNDIITNTPELKEYWDYDNNSVPPEMLTYGARGKYYFKCKNGHSFTKSLSAMRKALGTSTKGCPYCRSSIIRSGVNDLKTLYPDVAELWDTELNCVSPDAVAGKSDKVYWFKCPKNHPSFQSSVQSMVASRTSKSRGCPYCSGIQIKPGVNDFESQHPELMYLWDWDKNTITPDQISCKNNSTKIWFKCSNGHSYQTYIDSVVRSNFESCPRCSHNISSGSMEVHDYIESLGIHSVQEYILESGKRLDLYIPDLKLGIEYNGIYWHNETNRGRLYHREKYLNCLKEGIKLLFVWEDDWLQNQDVVKKILAYKLGCHKEQKVNARDCTVVELNTYYVRGFLEENHIQGYASGSFYLGLQDKDLNIVAVIVCKYESYGLNIVRYATCCSVRGGFSKLVRYIERNYDYSILYTFSDNGISDGGLYANNGFERADELPPDYMYVYQNKRIHKFNFRKNRFKMDPKLIWKEGLTERELADLNNIDRVWDAGKVRWVKKNPYIL